VCFPVAFGFGLVFKRGGVEWDLRL
jgi:hypothetical protein